MNYVSGMVYRNIRTVTGLVESGIDVLLGRLGAMIGEKESARGRESLAAVLNGMLGDHLVIPLKSG